MRGIQYVYIALIVSRTIIGIYSHTRGYIGMHGIH